MVNLFTRENERKKWIRKSENERKKNGKGNLEMWNSIYEKGFSFPHIQNFLTLFIFYSDARPVSNKLSKGRKQATWKNPIYYSFDNQPPLWNAPDCQQFPIADLPPPWPYSSTGTVLPRLQTDSWCLRKYKWISIILL